GRTEDRARGAVSGERTERRGGTSPLAESRNGHRAVIDSLVHLRDRHDAVGTRIGERTEERGIDDREEGRVGAAAEGERDDRHRRPRFLLRETPHRDPEVLKPAADLHCAPSDELTPFPVTLCTGGILARDLT